MKSGDRDILSSNYLHGYENGDVARGWSQNKRRSRLSIEKGLNSQLESGFFFWFLYKKIFVYTNKLNDKENKKIEELTHKIY